MRFTELYRILITGFLFLFVYTSSFAEYFANNASYTTCFTPGNNCANAVVNIIAQAKKQILVQAYNLTDIDIVNALIRAKKRGVEVNIILDKSQMSSKHTPRSLLAASGIKVLIDYKPATAHNKVIIVDQRLVVGGSYNYTANANKRNAENLLIIRDADFAKQYVKNWYRRERESVLMSNFLLSYQKNKKTGRNN